jgi:D-3-phosphoglycerate dehydrogenase / 2-oxoglutarate reductase
MKKVLITDDCHPYLMEGLGEMGYACDFFPDITPQETFRQIPEYHGLIINSKILVNQNFIDEAKQLEFVGRLGSGMEIVDRKYAAERGIKIISSPEGNRNAVAEQALGMLLTLANNILRADQEVRQNIWLREQNRGFELMGRSIGIIGYGHTGRTFADKLSGLGMEVMAYDKYLPSGYAKKNPFVQELELPEICQKADILSLHLPLTPETRHFVDQKFVNKCRYGFILINTSRGHCVKTEDLVISLENGKIGGACLDVFENEKPSTRTEIEQEWYKRLHRCPNVVLTPHIAGWTQESKRRMAEVLVKKIRDAAFF